MRQTIPARTFMLHELEHWLAEGLRASGPVALLGVFLGAVALGSLHSLLPGHGKTLLATTHASGLSRDGDRRSLRALRDAVVIGFMRAFTAALVALAGTGLADWLAGGALGSHGAEERTGAMVGVLFVALGGWFVWNAWRGGGHRHGPTPVLATASGTVDAAPVLGRSVLLIGLVPDPVSLGVLIAAAVAGAPVAGIVAALGLGTGMSLTLALFALGGVRARGLLGRTGALDGRLDRWLRLAGGIAVMGVGLVLVLA